MIARRLRMNNASKSNVKRLVAYLTDQQQHNQRVLDVQMQNCECDCVDEPEWTAIEMRATQEQNKRATGDKTYHLLLSFREEPTAETIQKIEDEICKRLGFAEHQRISVLHGDTDNLHLHVVINKIHPEKLTMHEPYYDHKTLAKACVELEQKYSLNADNHVFKKTARETAATAMEIAGDMESLTGWIQRECLDDLRRCDDWSKLHETLGKHNLELQPKGNGFVIASGGLTVKASSVDRCLSKRNLEKKLGLFEAKTTQTTAQKKYVIRPMQHATHGELWERYQTWKKDNDTQRQEALNNVEKNIQTEGGDLELALIKHVAKGAILKRLLYAMHAREQKEKRLKKLKAIRTRERKAIYKKNPDLTWRGWLQQEAMNGNAEALDAMRSRRKEHPNGNMIQSAQMQTAKGGETVPPDAVKLTHRGTILFDDGCRQTERGLIVPNRSGVAGIQSGLMRSSKKGLRIQGNASFTASVVQEATKLNISYNAFDTQEIRQAVLQAEHSLKPIQNQQRGAKR